MIYTNVCIRFKNMYPRACWSAGTLVCAVVVACSKTRVWSWQCTARERDRVIERQGWKEREREIDRQRERTRERDRERTRERDREIER